MSPTCKLDNWRPKFSASSMGAETCSKEKLVVKFHVWISCTVSSKCNSYFINDCLKKRLNAVLTNHWVSPKLASLRMYTCPKGSPNVNSVQAAWKFLLHFVFLCTAAANRQEMHQEKKSNSLASQVKSGRVSRFNCMPPLLNVCRRHARNEIVYNIYCCMLSKGEGERKLGGGGGRSKMYNEADSAWHLTKIQVAILTKIVIELILGFMLPFLEFIKSWHEHCIGHFFIRRASHFTFHSVFTSLLAEEGVVSWRLDAQKGAEKFLNQWIFCRIP